MQLQDDSKIKLKVNVLAKKKSRRIIWRTPLALWFTVIKMKSLITQQIFMKLLLGNHHLIMHFPLLTYKKHTSSIKQKTVYLWYLFVKDKAKSYKNMNDKIQRSCDALSTLVICLKLILLYSKVFSNQYVLSTIQMLQLNFLILIIIIIFIIIISSCNKQFFPTTHTVKVLNTSVNKKYKTTILWVIHSILWQKKLLSQFFQLLSADPEAACLFLIFVCLLS